MGNARPTPITVLGIINIVWGALKLLNALFGVAIAMLFAMPYFVNMMSSMPAPPRGGPSPASMFNMMKDPAYLAAIGVSHGLNSIGGIILLTAGIGLLRMQNWGRMGSFIYAGWACVSVLATQVMSWTVFMPMMNRMMASMGAGAGAPPNSVMAMSFVFGAIWSIAFGLAYPIVLVVYMTRPWLVSIFSTIPAVVEAGPMVTQESPPSSGTGE